MEVGQLHQKSPEPLAETSLYNIKKQTPSEASNKFCTRDSSNTEQNYKSIVSSKCCGDVLPTLHEQYFSKHHNHTKEAMSVTEMLHGRSKISCHHLPLTVFSFSIFLACAAWQFWLGALNNKGGRGQRNHEEIGAGATWKTACTDRGAFLSWSVRQRMDRCDWFRMFTRQSNILVISLRRISRDWTKHLHKTKSKYQRSVDQSIVDLEYLTGKQGNCIEA